MYRIRFYHDGGLHEIVIPAASASAARSHIGWLYLGATIQDIEGI